jgi:dihydrodipicolinate synthase/N-acetylneuraminate lyase
VKDYDEALERRQRHRFRPRRRHLHDEPQACGALPRNAEAGMVMVNLPTAGVDYHVPFGGPERLELRPARAGPLRAGILHHGEDGLHMVHQPPDPFVAPRGVIDYVSRIAEAGEGLPLMLYLRNDGIGLDAIEQLCRIPGVAGVKWATPAPLRLAEAIRRSDPQIVWVGGLAEVWAPPFCAVGARGFTSGLINVWPEQSVAIHKALEAGDYPRAMELVAVMADFEEIRAQEQNGANVTGVKEALILQGLNCGPTRPPSAWPLAAGQRERLEAMLARWRESHTS